jgi:hypothetical protein
VNCKQTACDVQYILLYVYNSVRSCMDHCW